MEKIYNKLIRDKIPEIIMERGAVPITKNVDNEEFEELLKEKLREESEEFIDNNKTDELVDILEIVYKLADLKGIDQDELENLRVEKQQKRGGFDKGIFLEKVVEEE